MAWTATNLVIQIIAGILGGHVAALVVKEHSFGALGHTIAGAVGGAVSGYFLQTIVGTVVNASGERPTRRRPRHAVDFARPCGPRGRRCFDYGRRAPETQR